LPRRSPERTGMGIGRGRALGTCDARHRPTALLDAESAPFVAYFLFMEVVVV